MNTAAYEVAERWIDSDGYPQESYRATKCGHVVLDEREISGNGLCVNCADPKLKRVRKVSRIARKLIALSHQLPDEQVARRFLNNCLRFDRIVNRRPVFGLRVQGSEVLVQQTPVETPSREAQISQ